MTYTCNWRTTSPARGYMEGGKRKRLSVRHLPKGATREGRVNEGAAGAGGRVAVLQVTATLETVHVFVFKDPISRSKYVPC